MRIGDSLELQEIYFKIPVLYIIGDTEGHDKICGRYLSRSNISRLCRCCNVPFEETDNPEFKYKYNKHKKLMKIVNDKTKNESENTENELTISSEPEIDMNSTLTIPKH